MALLLIALSACSQPGETIYLWPEAVPFETKLKADPVLAADEDDNVIRIAEVTNPSVLVYEPDPAKRNGAGIIICPGGGYHILAINLEGYEIAEWLRSRGYTVFVLQYRVPNNQAGALADAQRAVRIVRSRANEWSLNPNQLGVLGFSAGGSLSVRLSTLYKQTNYNAVDNADSLSCRPDFSMLIYPAYLDKGEGRSLTPELLVDAETPPMFIFATADDPYANSALVMASALRDQKVAVELHLLADGGHGYGIRTGNAAAETWPKLAETWLTKALSNEE